MQAQELDHIRIEWNLACLVALSGNGQDSCFRQVRQRFNAQFLVAGLGQLIQTDIRIDRQCLA